MAGLYPEIEPNQHGMLDVGDGNLVYWETCGNPGGQPAVVLHGGPGSGCTPWHRRLFDPDAYRVVLFDQRGCGRSRPHASAPDTDLTSNTTSNLIADIERLRGHLHIDRWLVWGGSWGSVLALAYAEQKPERVTEMILWGVATGRRSEFDWLFRGGVALFFPEQWERFRRAVPSAKRDGDIVDVYHGLLHDPDPEVRTQAALEWCMWESATPSWPPATGLASRFTDPAYAMAFARLVTHYVRHDAWLEDGSLLRYAESLAGIPGILVNGRFDFQSPIASAWDLHRAWPRAELVVVDDAGHDPYDAGITEALIRATDRFASR
ncbi:MAG TPA: prolyl aminopeptidase [Actinomycetota bacterium]